MEVAHGEFARACINWIAPAKPDGITLGNGAPVFVLFEQGQHMIVIARGLEIHEQRRLAMKQKSSSCNKGCFNAVAGIVLERHAGGLARITLRFEVDWDAG